jgi:hypothetical protein
LQQIEATLALVDIVSFQFFGEDETLLRRRIADLRTYTDKPLLLIAFGMSTLTRDESEQEDYLRKMIRVAETDDLAGWMIWAMYDFPTSVTCWPDPCASFDDARHHFGLWRWMDRASLRLRYWKHYQMSPKIKTIFIRQID